MDIFAQSNEPKTPENVESQDNGVDYEDLGHYGGVSQDRADMGKRQQTRLGSEHSDDISNFLIPTI